MFAMESVRCSATMKMRRAFVNELPPINHMPGSARLYPMRWNGSIFLFETIGGYSSRILNCRLGNVLCLLPVEEPGRGTLLQMYHSSTFAQSE